MRPHTTRMPASVCLLATLLLAGFALPIGAEPVWCDGEETLVAHPLNHLTLREAVLDAGTNQSLAKAIDLIEARFQQHQARSPDADARLHQAYLDAFLALLQAADGPADFRFTYQPFQARAFLATTGEHLVFMDCTLTPEQQNRDSVTVTNIALAAYAIDRIGGEIFAEHLKPVITAIDQTTVSYRNWLLDQGLAQWPWEMVANGWLHRGDPYSEAAPRSQLVLMRPNAGLELQWASQDEASADASVGIEPIGLVWYTGDGTNYANWWGISALVTLGTNDQGAGVGGLLRYKHYWLGITDRSGESDPYFFIGLDLHKYLKGDDGLKADLERWLDQKAD